ncbi:hypothetical protein CQ050_17735 [Achromobacter sp. MYb9]|nr:hypothetical protein CQ050_17735 [Achromobacter sp. MYb9]
MGVLAEFASPLFTERLPMTRNRFSRRAARLAAAAVLTSAVAMAHADDNVQFLLDWIPSGEFAAYYAGLSQGFFKEQGIDLKISRGFGGGDTVNKVGAGSAQFGIADIAPVFAARAKTGLPVKVISSMYVYSPHSMFVLESSGITSLADLKGKNVGITPGNSHKFYFPEVAKRVGLDESTVRWTNVDASTMASLLIAKKLDAAPFFAIHEYYINKSAQAQGEKIRVLPYVETGFTIYSSSILTSDNTLKSNPDLVKRFLAAIWKSQQWAHAHPEEACKLHVAQNPEVKADDCLGSFKAEDKYVFADFAAKTGFGKFDDKRLADTWAQVTKAQQLDPQWDYQQAVDTALVPAAAAK